MHLYVIADKILAKLCLFEKLRSVSLLFLCAHLAVKNLGFGG